MFHFQEEKFSVIFEELKPLIEEHYSEVCDVKEFGLQVNQEFYENIENTGFFKLFTARLNGELVGYSSFFVTKHHHYNMFVANQDSVFVSKKQRGFGHSFIKWCDEQLKESHIDIVYRSTKDGHNFSTLLEKQDYQLTELVYMKRLT